MVDVPAAGSAQKNANAVFLSQEDRQLLIDALAGAGGGGGGSSAATTLTESAVSSVTDTAQTIFAANADRVTGGVTITNNGPGAIWVRQAVEDAAPDVGEKIVAGGTFISDGKTRISAIRDTVDCNIYAVEGTV